MYAFHHIPKCAGSSLQQRMIMHEHNGDLANGSTLVCYDAVGREWSYKVSDDADYNPKESLHHQTFPRHRGQPVNEDNSNVTIAMGHSIDHSWQGHHITWIRNPYERDISHYNYDYNLGRINRTWPEWHQQMPTDWIVLWLYTRWLKQPETDAHVMYEAIVNSKLIIRPMQTFEKDYKFICEKLNVEPLSIKDNVQTDKNIPPEQLNEYDIDEHKDDNDFDWMLYELSVQKKDSLTHP